MITQEHYSLINYYCMYFLFPTLKSIHIHTRTSHYITLLHHAKLITIFNFPIELASRAVQAIGDKSDVTLAYNYCLDHGGEDTGGHVTPKQFCTHLLEHVHVQTYHTMSLHFPKNEDAMQQCSNPDCSGMKTMENWLCLACHSILCSRYVKSHALHHYETSGHCVAVSLADLSVWCYACNSYIRHNSLAPLLHFLEGIKFDGDNNNNEDESKQADVVHTTTCISNAAGYHSMKLPMAVRMKTGVAYQSSSSNYSAVEGSSSYAGRGESAADAAFTYVNDHESMPFARCVAVSNLNILMKSVCNGTLENGLALLDDARDPLCDVDAVAFAVDRTLKSYGIRRVLLVNWGLYEGDGKRMHNEDEDLEDLIIRPLAQHDNINGDGAKYISCPLSETLPASTSWNNVLSLARKWCPDLVIIRAGFSEGASCEEVLLENARNIICHSLGKILMPSAAGKLIVVPCTGGRPSLSKLEARVFARNSQVCLQALLAATECES